MIDLKNEVTIIVVNILFLYKSAAYECVLKLEIVSFLLFLQLFCTFI